MSGRIGFTAEAAATMMPVAPNAAQIGDRSPASMSRNLSDEVDAGRSIIGVVMTKLSVT